MSISVLQENSLVQSSSSATIVLAFANPVTPGSSIHVVANSFGGPVSATCSDSVNGSYPAADDTLSPGGNGNVGVQFHFNSTAAGTPTVTVTFNTTSNFIDMYIAEIGQSAGFDTHIAVTQTAVPSTTDGVTTGTQAPSQQPGLLHAVFLRYSGSGTLTVGTGFTAGLGNGTREITESLRYTNTSARAATATSSTNGADSYNLFASFFKEGSGVAAPILMGQSCL